MNDQPIMIDQPGLVKLEIVEMWRATDGHAYPDEHRARYASCTHVPCPKCSQPTTKHRTMCENCWDKAQRSRWQAMEKKPWDGVAPICTYNDDKFFWDEDDLYLYCEECDLQPRDLMLVHCRPDLGPTVDMSIFDDHLPTESDDVVDHPDIHAAMDALNAAIVKHAPYCWHPSKVAVDPDSLPFFEELEAGKERL